MTEQEIITGNELIAEFMVQSMVHPNDRRYHSSWDWLMPVVEKISSISHGSLTVNTFSKYRNGKHRCTIVSGYSFEHNNPTFKNICADDNNLLCAIYNAVIQFINWYNTKTTKK